MHGIYYWGGIHSVLSPLNYLAYTRSTKLAYSLAIYEPNTKLTVKEKAIPC